MSAITSMNQSYGLAADDKIIVQQKEKEEPVYFEKMALTSAEILLRNTIRDTIYPISPAKAVTKSLMPTKLLPKLSINLSQIIKEFNSSVHYFTGKSVGHIIAGLPSDEVELSLDVSSNQIFPYLALLEKILTDQLKGKGFHSAPDDIFQFICADYLKCEQVDRDCTEIILGKKIRILLYTGKEKKHSLDDYGIHIPVDSDCAMRLKMASSSIQEAYQSLLSRQIRPEYLPESSSPNFLFILSHKITQGHSIESLRKMLPEALKQFFSVNVTISKDETFFKEAFKKHQICRYQDDEIAKEMDCLNLFMLLESLENPLRHLYTQLIAKSWVDMHPYQLSHLAKLLLQYPQYIDHVLNIVQGLYFIGWSKKEAQISAFPQFPKAIGTNALFCVNRENAPLYLLQGDSPTKIAVSFLESWKILLNLPDRKEITENLENISQDLDLPRFEFNENERVKTIGDFTKYFFDDLVASVLMKQKASPNEFYEYLQKEKISPVGATAEKMIQQWSLDKFYKEASQLNQSEAASILKVFKDPLTQQFSLDQMAALVEKLPQNAYIAASARLQETLFKGFQAYLKTCSQPSHLSVRKFAQVIYKNEFLALNHRAALIETLSDFLYDERWSEDREYLLESFEFFNILSTKSTSESLRKRLDELLVKITLQMLSLSENLISTKQRDKGLSLLNMVLESPLSVKYNKQIRPLFKKYIKKATNSNSWLFAKLGARTSLAFLKVFPINDEEIDILLQLAEKFFKGSDGTNSEVQKRVLIGCRILEDLVTKAGLDTFFKGLSLMFNSALMTAALQQQKSIKLLETFKKQSNENLEQILPILKEIGANLPNALSQLIEYLLKQNVQIAHSIFFDGKLHERFGKKEADIIIWKMCSQFIKINAVSAVAHARSLWQRVHNKELVKMGINQIYVSANLISVMGKFNSEYSEKEIAEVAQYILRQLKDHHDMFGKVKNGEKDKLKAAILQAFESLKAHSHPIVEEFKAVAESLKLIEAVNFDESLSKKLAEYLSIEELPSDSFVSEFANHFLQQKIDKERQIPAVELACKLFDKWVKDSSSFELSIKVISPLLELQLPPPLHSKVQNAFVAIFEKLVLATQEKSKLFSSFNEFVKEVFRNGYLLQACTKQNAHRKAIFKALINVEIDSQLIKDIWKQTQPCGWTSQEDFYEVAEALSKSKKLDLIELVYTEFVQSQWKSLQLFRFWLQASHNIPKKSFPSKLQEALSKEVLTNSEISENDRGLLLCEILETLIVFSLDWNKKEFQKLYQSIGKYLMASVKHIPSADEMLSKASAKLMKQKGAISLLYGLFAENRNKLLSLYNLMLNELLIQPKELSFERIRQDIDSGFLSDKAVPESKMIKTLQALTDYLLQAFKNDTLSVRHIEIITLLDRVTTSNGDLRRVFQNALEIYLNKSINEYSKQFSVNEKSEFFAKLNQISSLMSYYAEVSPSAGVQALIGLLPSFVQIQTVEAIKVGVKLLEQCDEKRLLLLEGNLKSGFQVSKAAQTINGAAKIRAWMEGMMLQAMSKCHDNTFDGVILERYRFMQQQVRLLENGMESSPWENLYVTLDYIQIKFLKILLTKRDPKPYRELISCIISNLNEFPQTFAIPYCQELIKDIPTFLFGIHKMLNDIKNTWEPKIKSSSFLNHFKDCFPSQDSHVEFINRHLQKANPRLAQLALLIISEFSEDDFEIALEEETANALMQLGNEFLIDYSSTPFFKYSKENGLTDLLKMSIEVLSSVGTKALPSYYIKKILILMNSLK